MNEQKRFPYADEDFYETLVNDIAERVNQIFFKTSDAVTTISSESSDNEIATAKAVHDIATDLHDDSLNYTDEKVEAVQNTISNPNLLDNWYFADPINQRGKTEYTNAGYTIDRWNEEVDTTLQINDGCILVTNSSSDDKGIIQVMETVPKGTTTLSILVEEGYGKAFIVNKESIAINGSGLYSLTYSDIDIQNNMVFIRANPYSSIKIIAAKLELGDRQTLARQDENGNWLLNDPPPNKALELVKCQRFLLGGQIDGIESFKLAKNVAGFVIPLPTTMRATPSIVGLYIRSPNRPNEMFLSDQIYSVQISNNTLYVYTEIPSELQMDDLGRAYNCIIPEGGYISAEP